MVSKGWQSGQLISHMNIQREGWRNAQEETIAALTWSEGTKV